MIVCSQHMFVIGRVDMDFFISWYSKCTNTHTHICVLNVYIYIYVGYGRGIRYYILDGNIWDDYTMGTCGQFDALA